MYHLSAPYSQLLAACLVHFKLDRSLRLAKESGVLAPRRQAHGAVGAYHGCAVQRLTYLLRYLDYMPLGHSFFIIPKGFYRCRRCTCRNRERRRRLKVASNLFRCSSRVSSRSPFHYSFVSVGPIGSVPPSAFRQRSEIVVSVSVIPCRIPSSWGRSIVCIMTNLLPLTWCRDRFGDNPLRRTRRKSSQENG